MRVTPTLSEAATWTCLTPTRTAAGAGALAQAGLKPIELAGEHTAAARLQRKIGGLHWDAGERARLIGLLTDAIAAAVDAAREEGPLWIEYSSRRPVSLPDHDPHPVLGAVFKRRPAG